MRCFQSPMAVDNRTLVKWPKYPHFKEVKEWNQMHIPAVSGQWKLLWCSFHLPDRQVNWLMLHDGVDDFTQEICQKCRHVGRLCSEQGCCCREVNVQLLLTHRMIDCRSIPKQASDTCRIYLMILWRRCSYPCEHHFVSMTCRWKTGRPWMVALSVLQSRASGQLHSKKARMCAESPCLLIRSLSLASAHTHSHCWPA